jgi:DNA-binding transcriptional LysR family regulator
MLNDDLAAGRLVQGLPGYESPARSMYLLFAPDRRPTPILHGFIVVMTTFGE